MEGHGHFVPLCRSSDTVIKNVNSVIKDATSVIKDRHVVTLTAEDIKRLNVEEVLNGLNGELSVEDVDRLTGVIVERGGGDHSCDEGVVGNGDCGEQWTVGVEVDESPLQNQLQKNKESLKVKLMVRRPMNTLVEQGIMPEYKTSPSLHEKITKLERAKMGDMLKAKIACRPERADLVNRHILEDVRPDVDPSLCERQRQLKRAKLADSLASQLSHRPGPLELIQKNILHTDDPVEQAVKEGTLQFRPTVEGVGTHWWEPTSSTSTVILNDEDSVSSDTNFGSPSQGDLQSDSSVSSVHALLSRLEGPEFTTPSSSSPTLQGRSESSTTKSEWPATSPPRSDWPATSPPRSDWSATSPPSPRSGRSESLGDIAAVASPAAVVCPPPHQRAPRSGSFGGSWGNLTSLATPTSGTNGVTTSLSNGFRGEFNLTHGLASGPSLQREAPGKDQSRKKVKAKSNKPVTAPKPRTIKFHEYKGPTREALKRTHEDKTEKDTSYDLLLKQQQLFLQWQLENQNKFPQILLPATEKVAGRASIMSLGASSGTSSSQASSSVPSPASSVPGTPRATTPSFRSSTPIRTMVLTPQDVNHATSLMNKLDEMKVTDLKQELKKRNLTVSGSKPALVERLRPVLEGIIAAGRQQFQQPYKQINIPQGGLIILKPSPNSQLLTKPEPNSEVAPPTPMHESTPDPGDDIVMAPMTPMAAPLTPILSNGPCTPFSPAGMLSPTGSLHNDSQQSYNADSPLDGLLSEGSPAPNMDLDFNLDLMEEDHKLAPPPAPPPPPPPPPPTAKTFTKPTPAPLPPPPNQCHFVPNSGSIQFLPPKTKQQILLAKQQLEAQQQNPSPQMPPTPVRAGPKGQFIWPPVSLQSGQGTVTIRPAQSSLSDSQTVYSVVSSQSPHSVASSQPQHLQMSSTPVSQLAQVFSNQTPLPKSVRLPQEPVPKAQLRLSMPVSLNNGTVSLPENVPLPSEPSDSLADLTDPADPVDTSSPVTLTVQLPLNAVEVNQLPMETVNLSQLPATLPLPHHQVKQEPQRVLTNVQLSPEDTLRVTEDIIAQQQHKIEELQTALQRSQQQLQLHQNLLKAEHKKQSEVKQEPSGGNSSMKMLLAQQLQNKQIASQIQQLQASQIKVQQQQAAVMPFVNCNKQPNAVSKQPSAVNASAGYNGLSKSKVLPKYVIVQDQNTNIEQIHEIELTGQPSNAANNQQDSMDDVLEILIRNGDLPASVAQTPSHSRHQTSKVSIPAMFQTPSHPSHTPSHPSQTPSHPSASAPPPPPPPPSKHPPMEFPPLDLADLSFDLSQLPELPLDGVTPTDSSQESCQDSSQESCQDSFMDDVMAESMDVDMDVADWLETILPNKNQNSSNDMETVTNGSIDLEGHNGVSARNVANANLNMDQLLKWVDGGGHKN